MISMRATRMLPRLFECLALILLLMAYIEPVRAHSGSTAFIELAPDARGAHGEWLLALRDADVAVGIDRNRDGELTWGELRAQTSALDEFAHTQIVANAGERACALTADTAQAVRLDDLVYLRWPLHIDCAGSVPTALWYRALFERDSSHRVLLKWQSGGASMLHVLSPQQARAELGADRGAMTLLVQGFLHILEGADHLLFLLALLVPVLCDASDRRGRQLFALISAFTLGHSLTLALTTLGIWAPPVRVVECAIAATVIVAGINIVFPLFRDRSIAMAFAFGLIHGCGMAKVLLDLHLPRSQFVIALLQFNLGVEAGQLLLIVMTAPLLLLLQRALDRRHVRAFSAMVTTSAGFWWLIQRLV